VAINKLGVIRKLLIKYDHPGHPHSDLFVFWSNLSMISRPPSRPVFQWFLLLGLIATPLTWLPSLLFGALLFENTNLMSSLIGAGCLAFLLSRLIIHLVSYLLPAIDAHPTREAADFWMLASAIGWASAGAALYGTTQQAISVITFIQIIAGSAVVGLLQWCILQRIIEHPFRAVLWTVFVGCGGVFGALIIAGALPLPTESITSALVLSFLIGLILVLQLRQVMTETEAKPPR
jgi:hypothetical protein